MAERRYTLVFVIALLTAGAATFGIFRALEASKASNRIATQPVVIAAQDMTEGQSIDRVNVQVAQWPSAAVPAGAFGTVDSIVGRVTRISVFKGEPIVPGRLAPAGTGPGLEVKITPGKRAFSVRIDDVAGLNGLIQPNSRVDVLVTLQDSAGGGQVSKTFMSNMRVLAVGTAIQTTADSRPISAPTATLEVTPEEAEQLAIAGAQGKIQLILRGYGDPDSITTTGARSNDVLAQLRAAPTASAPAPAAPRRTTNSTQRRAAARAAENATKAFTTPVAPPPPIVVAPVRPDSSSVEVYRGEKVSRLKFEKKDSLAKDSIIP